MTIAVIGAAPANLAAISRAASGIQVRLGAVPRGASWVIVATAAQRRQAVAASSGLPAFRVVHVPGLDRDGAVDVPLLAEGLARMREIGPYVAQPSAAALAVTRWLLPWIRPALERWLGDGAATVDARLSNKAALNAREVAARAERRAALERAGLVKPITPDQARQLAERKARRKAERRAREPLISDAPAKPPSR